MSASSPSHPTGTPAGPLAPAATELRARDFLIRPPTQARSRRTLERMVEAARTLLRESGPDAVTVQEVAERAGVSIGAFYARFEGKEALIRYLGESDLEALLANWEEARPPNTDGHTLLEEFARYLLWSFDAGPARRLEGLDRIEDPAPTRVERARARLVADIEGALAPYCEPDLRRRIAARLLMAGARELAREGEAPWNPGRDFLALALADSIARYLRVARPDSEPDPPAEPEAEPHTRPDPPVEPEAPDAPEQPERPAGGVDPFDVWG